MPSTTGEITDSCILETTTSFKKKFYLKITKPTNSLNHIMLQIGNKFNDDTQDLEEGKCSTTAKLSWYRRGSRYLYRGLVASSILVIL